jgi:uncharacterized protein (DUF2147 family)
MSKYFLFILVFGLSVSMSAQDVFGKWISIDDKTNEEKSVVEIYKKDGKVFGKIVELLRSQDRDSLCEKCEGEDYNKPVLGFELIKNMSKDGAHYENGTIFDPENGKKYKCRLALDTRDPNILEVRGYIAFIYATQYWKRIEE